MRAVPGVAAEAATYKAAAMVAEWKSVTMHSDNTGHLAATASHELAYESTRDLIYRA